MTQSLGFDIAHLLAGGMLVLSFVLLYQDRITAVLNVFALQAIALSLSVAWQSVIQDAPHLLVTAAIALVVKGVFIPAALAFASRSGSPCLPLCLWRSPRTPASRSTTRRRILS